MAEFTDSDRQALARFLGKEDMANVAVGSESARPKQSAPNTETTAFINGLVSQGKSMDEALIALHERLRQAGKLNNLQASLPDGTRRLLDRTDLLISSLDGKLKAREAGSRPGQQDKTRRQS